MNKVMLIGNVGKEPDVKYYDADQAVAQFPLATTERGYVLQNGTRVPDRTDWHNIVMWGNLAKIAEKYYDDKKGQRRFVTEIYADNMELLTSRQAQQQQPAVAEAEQPKPAPASASINKNNNDDTLPF